MNASNILTTAMAAKILGFTPAYLRRLCAEGKIKAFKHGHDWSMTKASIAKIKRQRKAKES